MREKTVNESLTTMTEMVMPNDANPMGNLMGGNLMRWMDIVGGIAAGKHCEAITVTASVDNISFQKPIHVGDIVTLKAQVTRAFNTSVEVYVEVSTHNIKGQNPQRSNNAYFTFVALDDDTKKPIKVPKFIPISEEEQRLFEGASRRREVRLVLSGRMKPDEAKDLKALFS